MGRKKWELFLLRKAENVVAAQDNTCSTMFWHQKEIREMTGLTLAL